MEQFREVVWIIGQIKQDNMFMDESINIACIIDKFLPSWKNMQCFLKHEEEELTLL